MILQQVGDRRASFQELSNNFSPPLPVTLTVGSPFSSFPSILNCLTQWALIELARNPDVQDTLRAELQSDLGPMDDSACSHRVNSVPYLDAFTSEVLRTP